MKSRLIGLAIYLTSIGTGVLYFLYPFFLLQINQQQSMDSVHSSDTPFLYMFLLGLTIVVLLFEVQGEAAKTRQIALLGVLVAINSVLRFIDIAIPGPGGFSPIFFLIILTGVVFGSRFGFLMGALTLFVSAIITGGVGPWLPAQMFTSGWVGMSSALFSPLITRLRLAGKPGEVWILVGVGFIWGLVFGAVMDLWAWPFIIGPVDQYWTPGISLVETLQRFFVYYLITSLPWDLARSLGNVLLIGLFGAPTLRVLRRFKRKMTVTFETAPNNEAPTDLSPAGTRWQEI